MIKKTVMNIMMSLLFSSTLIFGGCCGCCEKKPAAAQPVVVHQHKDKHQEKLDALKGTVVKEGTNFFNKLFK